MPGVEWGRARVLVTPILMLAAFALIAVGIFQIFVPAGWIFTGLAVLFVAYVTDTPEVPRR